MAEVRSKDQLRVWLEDKPSDVAVVVAARAALRVVPLLVFDAEADKVDTVVLHGLQAIAATWTAGMWPAETGFEETPPFASVETVSAAARDASLAFNTVPNGTASAAARAAAHSAFVHNSGDAAADAAADAAYAIYSSADSGDLEDVLWDEISADTHAIDSGMEAEEVCSTTLWKSGFPLEMRRHWSRLAKQLLGRDRNWRVWVEWYGDRLSGPNGRAIIQELEIARVLAPNIEDWEQGPAHVNAILAELERQYRGEPERPSREQEADLVPEQRPAVIEVELGDDGFLHRKPVVSPEVRDEDQRARLEAAWRAHLDTVKRLVALNPQGRGLEGLLDAYKTALGESFDGLRVIDLGIYGLSLQEMAERADEVLIGSGAALLKAVGTSHGIFIRQLPAWRAYLDDAEPEPPQEAVQDAVRILRMTGQFTQVMGEDVIVAANTLADLTLPLMADPAQRASLPLSREAVSSTENLLSGLLEPAYRAAKAVGTVAGEEALKGFGIGVRTITAAVTIGTSAEVLGLAEKMPGTFGWVKQVVATIKGALK